MKKKGFKKKLAAALSMALLIPSMSPVLAVESPAITVKSVEFVGMAAPTNAQDMASAYTTAQAKVTYSDSTTKLFPLSYKKLFKSTDSINGTPAGLAVDVNRKPIMDNSTPGNPVPFVSDAPDSNSLLKVDGAQPTGQGGNPLSLITHYEYITSDNSGKSAYGLVPASMSLSTINQDKKTGDLSVTGLKKVDYAGVGGLWIPCNGSLSPWNTHLSSEEYEPDARAFEADPSQTYVSSFTKNYFQDASKKGNPYAYGYIPEVTVKADNTTSVVKHYSMGRFSHELSKVMPDNKTVLFGDDGGNTMLFMYVADKERDLSAGTLYAGKWVQTSTENGGSANLKWIKLGHASDSELKSYIDKDIKFSDIFETTADSINITTTSDTLGFKNIKTYPSGKKEWLKVKPGMETAAAFLESRRYGALLGATSEFNKMEGVTLNAKDNKVYIAMSYMEKGMEKDTKGEAQDDIQLPKIVSGVTYELSLQPGHKDKDGNSIDSNYVPATMSGLVVGEDLATPDAVGNTAAVDKVANPDNLSFSEETRTLFIGEDSGMHTNNFVWAYNVDTKKLSRILSVPAGAEATGLQAVDNLNGFSYIMSNLQHPGDELAGRPAVPDALKAEIGKYIDETYDNKKAGMVGYISGLPSLTMPKEDTKAEKEFTISNAKLETQSGIKATVTVTPSATKPHAGTEAVVFQLMKGTTPVSIVATESDIDKAQNVTAHFNVPGQGYSVRTYVVDKYGSDISDIGTSLANPQELK
ncbi:PhoX family protein [Aneurinibacillus tyrosinisolvens]|uniref:PhoX family protein n=1 Tax=Aneurinibacillus tyrosinisolvens TaxID=1443435 RepID=UPI0009E33719|nr:alkaline phosphatase PhoX [Aneurinibacillus tyrosinisolvens]